MKILFAGAYVPYPLNSGGRLRSYHLLRWLATRHEVSLLALSHEPLDAADLIPLRELCRSLDTVPAPRRAIGFWPRIRRVLTRPEDIVMGRASAEMEAELQNRLKGENWDLLFLDELGTERYLQRVGERPAVLSKHNVEWQLLRRLAWGKRKRPWAWCLAWLEALAARYFEARVASRVGRVILVSEVDRQALLQCAPGARAFVVPNGVDTAYFRPPEGPAPTDDLVLFTGAMFWYPNVEAVLYFSRSVWPLIQRKVSRARLRIVGCETPPVVWQLGSLPGIQVIGPVNDVRPHLACASVYVAPLLSGSGTRLKILEALACGRAVVASSLGVEGLDLVPGEEIIVADKPPEFAAAVAELLQERSRREALEQAGRKAVEARYDWAVVLANLDRVCAIATGAGQG